MIPSYDNDNGIPPDGFTFVLTFVIIIIIMIIMLGFAVNLRASNCAMPYIKTYDKIPYISNCPSICDCNNTYDECQIPACNYTRYWISWYNIGIISKGESI